MRFDDRVVTRMPVEELWIDEGFVNAVKIRDLDTSMVGEMLSSNNSQFVVANIGDPLRWISTDNRYEFWKSEAKGRIADPSSKVDLEGFPDEYCYFASEWRHAAGLIILLEKIH